MCQQRGITFHLYSLLAHKLSLLPSHPTSKLFLSSYIYLWSILYYLLAPQLIHPLTYFLTSFSSAIPTNAPRSPLTSTTSIPALSLPSLLAHKLYLFLSSFKHQLFPSLTLAFLPSLIYKLVPSFCTNTLAFLLLSQLANKLSPFTYWQAFCLPTLITIML